MRILTRYSLILAFIVIIILLGVFLKDFSRNVALIHGVKSVQEGSYFTLSIDEEAILVAPKLTALGLDDITKTYSHKDRVLQKSDAIFEVDDIYIFQDNSFRRGIVWVSIKEQKIIEIRSDYSAVML